MGTRVRLVVSSGIRHSDDSVSARTVNGTRGRGKESRGTHATEREGAVHVVVCCSGTADRLAIDDIRDDGPLLVAAEVYVLARQHRVLRARGGGR